MIRTERIAIIVAATISAACSEGGMGSGSGNAAPAASMPDAVTADPAHYTVLFENDIARLLRIKYAPGEKSVMHSHPAGCGFILVDHTMKFTMQNGDSIPGAAAIAGEAVCFDEEVHLPQNVGTVDGELVLLELKGRKTFDNVQTGRTIEAGASGDVHDAVASDPAHYSVQFENDVVRVLRIKFAGPAKSVMHAHPALCDVQLSGGATTDTDAKGVVTKAVDEPRKVGCGDALVHMPEVTSAKGLEAFLVEFKGRKTFK